MTARSSVLNAKPWFGWLQAAGTPSEDEVRVALEEVQRTGALSREDVRVVSYAHYAGLEEAIVSKIVTNCGAAHFVMLELESHASLEIRDPIKFAQHLDNGGTEMALVQYFSDAQVGWALTVMSLADELYPGVLAHLVGCARDTAQLIAIYLIIRNVESRQQQRAVRRLLRANSDLTLACARTLVWGWMHSEIVAGDRLATNLNISALLSTTPKARALALFGGVLNELTGWVQWHVLSESAQQRAQLWYDEIEQAGRALVTSAADVDKVIAAAGERDIQVLSAIAHWIGDQAFNQRAAEQLGRYGRALFLREFASSMEVDVTSRSHDIAYPEWVTGFLIEALTHTGLDVADFDSAYAGLASDRFSQITRFSAWLRDRQRAICLIVIGARVALARNEDTLLAAARRTALHAAAQPAHGSQIVNEHARRSLADEAGFSIPGS